MPYSIAVLVGSLRKDSLNRKLAHTLLGLSPKELALEIVDIGQLALFNQDFDDQGEPPRPWSAFREHIRQSNGVLFITPEYNRSVPGVLKNAIDVGSRPAGKSAWKGKPAAIITASPGTLGGFGANHHLRQMLVALDMPTMQHPEAYISGAGKLFDENGTLSNDSTREFLNTFLNAYVTWLTRLHE